MEVTENNDSTEREPGQACEQQCPEECEVKCEQPCDAGPCKRMKKEEEEEEEESNPPTIGQSGLYALAKCSSLSDDECSGTWSGSSMKSAPSKVEESKTHKNISPCKSFEGDTQHLSSFYQFLHGVNNINTNCCHGDFGQVNMAESTSYEPPTSKCAQKDTTVAMETQTSCFHGVDQQNEGCILPVSLLVNIFHYVSMSDLLCRISRVCRVWYQAAHDPSLWRHISLPATSRVSDSVLNWLTSQSDRVMTLDVSDSKHTTFTDEGMIQILKKCHYIRTLKLARYFVFSDDVFESVGMYCHQVRHLNLDGCFSISDKSIISIGTGCPLLEYLYMSQCNRISDEGMLAVAKGCPLLKQLRIDQCVKVKDVSVQALVSGCPDLEYLHLLACSLTDDGLQQLAKLQRLRMLDISNMTQLSSNCLESIARSCKQLEVLSVSLNRTVDDECIKTIVQSCVHLKCLSCVACNLTDKTLEHIGQYSRTLERVDVAWCGEITDAGVEKISETCKSLRYLGLMRCGQVTMETVDRLIPLYPHIHYSNFVLESRKLLQRVKNDGHHVLVPENF